MLDTRSHTHPQVEAEFYKAFEKRPHHAWILKGPKGIGKLDFALTIASKLLSKEGNTHAYDQVQNNSHPNFLYVSTKETGLQTISIEQIRKISHFISQTTVDGDWKVIVLDNMNALTVNGANGLLKALESPTPKTIFFLIHHNGSTLLSTIVSRCAQLNFHPFGKEKIKELLSANLMPDEQSLLINLSQGCPKQLEELQETEMLSFCKNFLSVLSHFFENQNDLSMFNSLKDVSKNNKKFDLCLLILQKWLQQNIKAAASEHPEPSPFPIFSLSLGGLLEAHQEILKIIKLNKILNLDNQQVLLNIFFKLGEIKTL